MFLAGPDTHPSEYWSQLQYAREALHKYLIPLVAPDASGVA